MKMSELEKISAIVHYTNYNISPIDAKRLLQTKDKKLLRKMLGTNPNEFFKNAFNSFKSLPPDEQQDIMERVYVVLLVQEEKPLISLQKAIE